jgi:DnaA-homolog protein
MQQLVLDLLRPPQPTLDNFAAGANDEAVSALRKWLSGNLQERCIYLWGPPGSGKSHLLRATVGAAQSAGYSAMYASAPAHESLEAAHGSPWLTAVDAADQLSDAAQAALFRWFHHPSETAARLLVAADSAPAGLTLREDLRTRLGAGLVFQLRLLSDADKGAALRAHAVARGFDLDPDLIDYLLRHAQRDLPSLMSVLDALDQYSLSTKRTITVPLLRELLQLAKR